MRDIITAVVFGVLIAGAGFWIYNLHKEIYDLETQQSIAINNGVLAEVQKFTFAELTNSYSHVHEKRGFLWKGIYEYQWDFTYQFGFQVPDNHNWRIRHVGNETVSITVPRIQQMNNYDFNLTVAKRINWANGKHSIQMEEEMKEIALRKVKTSAETYLSNETIKIAVRRSVENFFLEILAEKSLERPVSKIEVHFL